MFVLFTARTHDAMLMLLLFLRRAMAALILPHDDEATILAR